MYAASWEILSFEFDSFLDSVFLRIIMPTVVLNLESGKNSCERNSGTKSCLKSHD